MFRLVLSVCRIAWIVVGLPHRVKKRHVFTHPFIYLSIHLSTYMCTYIHIYTYKYIVCVCVCVYIYIHIHMHGVTIATLFLNDLPEDQEGAPLSFVSSTPPPNSRWLPDPRVKATFGIAGDALRSLRCSSG